MSKIKPRTWQKVRDELLQLSDENSQIIYIGKYDQEIKKLEFPKNTQVLIFDPDAIDLEASLPKVVATAGFINPAVIADKQDEMFFTIIYEFMRYGSIINSCAAHHDQLCYNMIANMGNLHNVVVYNELKDRYADIPVIIWGAGTNLQEVLDEIEDVDNVNNCLNIAVERSVKPLQDKGIEIDIISAVDVPDHKTHLFDDLPEETLLITPPKSHVDYWQQQRYKLISREQHYVWDMISDYCRPPGNVTNVAQYAYTFARGCLGDNPLLIVGCDMAKKEDSYYFDKNSDNEDLEQIEKRTLDAKKDIVVNGITTNRDWLGHYHSWQSMSTNDDNCYCTTKNGLYIANPILIKTFINNFSHKNKPDGNYGEVQCFHVDNVEEEVFPKLKSELEKALNINYGKVDNINNILKPNNRVLPMLSWYAAKDMLLLLKKRVREEFMFQVEMSNLLTETIQAILDFDIWD